MPDNYKPSQAESASRKSTISHGENDRWNLTLADESGDGKAKYAYSGKRKDLKRSYALLFDQNSHTCTLEPLSSAYTFNIQATPKEPSAAKLAERYPKLKPKDEVPLEDAHIGLDSDAGDVAGSADEGNPYDFRHYLKPGRDISRSVSPDRSAVNTPRSEASRSTPLLQGKPKQTKQPIARARKSPPTGATPSKARSSTTPSVRLDRRASTRPTDSQPSKKLKTVTKPTSRPTGKPTSKLAVKSDYYVQSSSDDERPTQAPPRPAPDANDNGLEIDFGDSAPRSRGVDSLGKNKKGLALPGGTPGAGPVSLRSAMNSANATPERRVHTPLLKTKHESGDGQIIDFGDTSAPASEEDEEGGYDEDVSEGDDDIEPMTLGSPAHDTSKATSAHPEEREPERPQTLSDEDADGDADDDFEADFEAEMQGLASQEEEENMGGAGAAVAQGDESEESEEE